MSMTTTTPAGTLATDDVGIDVERNNGVRRPGNIVVCGDGEDFVEPIPDPQLMAAVTDLPAMTTLAEEASTRLNAVRAALAG